MHALALWTLVSALTGDMAEPATTEPVLSLSYYANNGSLPPPHRRSTTLTIEGDGLARYSAIHGYDRSDPARQFTREFRVDAAQLRALRSTLAALDAFTRNWEELERPPVGGPTRGAQIRCGNQEATIPAFPIAKDEGAARSILDAISALVPESIHAERTQWARGLDSV